ncbi:MAG TPA: HAMP domain-containing sensor histidine kinase [Thermomicrobiales bacterium]|nr:HAMP domain-containing sensor histidine kinase [Thermomicrobiales bacterium]
MPTYDEDGVQTGAIMAIREVSEKFVADDAGGQSPVELLVEARRRVELLASLSTEIAARRGSEDFFDLIASRASEILQADAAMVMTPAANSTFVPRAMHNLPANLVGRQLNRFAFPSAVLSMAHRDIQYVNEDEASPAGVELLREIDALRRVDPDLARAVGRQCGNAVQLHNVVVELEASRRRLQTTLAQLPQAVVITDEHEGNVVAMNREAQALWGTSKNWLGRHASDISMLDERGQHYPPDRHPFLRPLRTRQTEFGVPMTTRGVNGEQIDVVGNMAAIVGQNGELRGAVAVLQRREHFKAIDRAKDEFISVVAHELRNPLTSLRGNIQMVKRRLDRMETEEARWEVDRVAGVIEQVDRIGDLVSSMLNVSRADLGKLTITPAPTDAVRLEQGVIAQLESQLDGRKITIDAPNELPVEWDSIRVQQILINLITNAIRYAPEGDIDVAVAPEGDTVAISVRVAALVCRSITDGGSSGCTTALMDGRHPTLRLGSSAVLASGCTSAHALPTPTAELCELMTPRAAGRSSP